MTSGVDLASDLCILYNIVLNTPLFFSTRSVLSGDREGRGCVVLQCFSRNFRNMGR